MTSVDELAPDKSYVEEFRRRLKGVEVDRGEAFPWRASRDPFVVLLSEILLQRTRGPNVAKVFPVIVRRVPEPRLLARMPIQRIERMVRPLGLLKRAPILKRLGKALVREHGGEVPADRDELLALPGVGRYTAAAVRCFAFGKREAIVDAGIGRIIRRCLGLTESRRVNSDDDLWNMANVLLPERGSRHHNLALLTIAARHCRVIPRCTTCPLVSVCRFGTRSGTTKTTPAVR